MIALIDGDILVYQQGFSADKVWYTVGKKRFKYHKTAKNWCKRYNRDLGDIVKHHEPGELKDIIVNLDKVIESIIKETRATETRLFLTGDNNFRIDVAVTHEYKGNRCSSKRPFHYTAIREYLLDRWDAELILNQEADDALGINQMQCDVVGINSVICSIDKDLDMIPGWHYNWNKGKDGWNFVTTAGGWKSFYKQMLMGDRTDNIFGIRGIGEVTALNILKGLSSPQEMMCAVGREYAIHFDDPEARMVENAHLLYIRKYKEDTWSFDYHEKEIKQEEVA